MNLTGLMKRAACVACMLAASSHAQTVYRIVGPDGKVTFSDKPPVSAEQGKVLSSAGAGAASAGSAGLPFELRQAASKYPVTFYSASDCGPCVSARALLSSRGVPFTERTVASNEDIAALKRISGETSLPFLTIGTQRIKGFADAEWTQYLDAAGYPKTSVLPAGYRQAPATPLVAAVEKQAQPKPEPKAEAAPEPAPAVNTGPSPANPAGIRF